MLKKLSGSGWAMLEYGYYPLLLFAFTPWFLNRLGPELYGHWMLLLATVGMGGVLNTGTGAAVIKAVSEGIGRRTTHEIVHALNVSLGIALVCGGGLGMLVSLVFWLGGPALFSNMGDATTVRLTGTVAALLLWIEQIDYVFSSATKGAEHFGLAARIEIASKTLQVLAAALAVALVPQLWALYAALILVAVMRLCGKYMVVGRWLDWPKLRPALGGSRRWLNYAGWGWVQGVGGAMFSVADRILVASLLGSTVLTHYAIASQLAMQVHAASAAALGVIFPMISRNLAADPQYSPARLMRFAMLGNVGLCTLLAIALWILGPTLVELWLGRSGSQAIVDVLPYLVAAYWLLALNVTPHYALLSVGRVRYVAFSNLVAGCVLIVVVAVTASVYGLIGVAIARSLYGLVLGAALYPMIGRVRLAVHA